MKKVFVLDTNIIFNDAHTIELLSDKGQNMIVLPITVQDEADANKTGFEDINFQVRELYRMFDDAVVVGKMEKINGTAKKIEICLEKTNTRIHLIELDAYSKEVLEMDSKTRNDGKIIETAERMESYYDRDYDDYIILSNDIAFRTRCLFKGLKVQSFKLNEVDGIEEISFVKTVNIKNDSEVTNLMNLEDLLGEPCPPEVCSFEIVNTVTNNRFYGIKENGKLSLLWEHDKNNKLSGQYAYPKNTEQKFMYAMMLSNNYDLVISDSSAGTGKTILCLSAACHLMDKEKEKYNKIIYSRKTVISGDKLDELGFMKGGLAEKMAGYLAPLEDTIENFVLNGKDNSGKKKPPMKKEELEKGIEEFKSRYSIDFVYQGHLRGRTLSNSIIILDEIQSNTVTDIQTILTRVGESCKVFIMGSTRQIDNPYLNKSNNALSFLLNETRKDNEEGVTLGAVRLIKTERSKMAEWADKFNQK